MPRRKKLRPATAVKTASGLSVDIMYDPNELEFVSEFQGKEYRMGAADDLRRKMFQVLKDAEELDFKPVIIVHTLRPFGHLGVPFAGIFTKRQYVAKAYDGHLRVIHWDVWDRGEGDSHFDPVRAARYEWWSPSDGEFTLPYIRDNVRDANTKAMYYLPYTEELWEGLEEIKRGIERLRLKLADLLGTEDGVKQITNVGGNLLKLLPPPADEGEERE